MRGHLAQGPSLPVTLGTSSACPCAGLPSYHIPGHTFLFPSLPTPPQCPALDG